MSIIIGSDKPIVAVGIGKRVLAAVYAGIQLVWLAVSSCFGAGYWAKEKSWSNTEAWSNKPR